MEHEGEMYGIVQYIQSHISDQLTADTLAARLYLSKFHFHRLFTGMTGVPVARYIREQKLHYALLLLVGTDARVTDIAYGLGFNSHDAFTRAFRQAYHETPSGMRSLYAARRLMRGILRLSNSILPLMYEKNSGGPLQDSQNKTMGGNCMNDLFSDAKYLTMAPFTPGDKRDCLPTMELLLQMSEVSRNEGLLALESFKEKDDNMILKKGIDMICDGCPPELVKQVLQNYVISSNYRGAELLKRILLSEIIPEIPKGFNPTIVRELLLSLLGEDFYEEAFSYLGLEDDSYANTVEPYLKGEETWRPGTNLLEEYFLDASDRVIQITLRETDMKDFVPAFYGSSKKIQNKFCANLSKRLAMQVVHACEDTGATTETGTIIKAQHVMLSLFHKAMADVG
jgi:AraC-like DNA-binding protein